MSRQLQKLEAALQDIGDLVDEPAQARFMKLVARLEASRTDAALGILFARFADEPSDIMECLIHAVESFPRKMYAHTLARELLPLSKRSREWVVILHMRLLQSTRDLSCYVDALAGAGPEIQAALQDILREVAVRRPDLAPVVTQTIQTVAVRGRLAHRATTGQLRKPSAQGKQRHQD